MNKMRVILPFILAFVAIASVSAQQTKRALFVGNSYTYVNDLPSMIANMAASVGDELHHTSSTPGGCTFQQHCANQSMNYIQQGGWDIVVLQEQSQYPSFPQEQVESEVFPYAAQLVNAIYASSPCAEPMFYMTWGRRDGDQQNAQYFPVLGTYEGMDSMLYERYMYMAQTNDASVSPVGRVWRLLRSEHPEIELYDRDGSHPSLAGTYAAACTFFAMMFHHDPAELTYRSNLTEETAMIIRAAASQIVWSTETSMIQPQWTRPLPTASLQNIGDSTIYLFSNASTNADSLVWLFGDGTSVATSADIDTISHSYTDEGDYTVTLVASRHCMTDTATLLIHVTISDTSSIDTTGTNPHNPNGINSQFTNLSSQFTIFPTITSGIITIVASTSSVIEADIITPAGQIIKRPIRQSTNQALMDLSSLPKGLYLLRLTQDDRQETHKVIKR